MAAPNQQQQQAPPNQVYMIRPGQIDSLPNLADSIRTQYKQGLASLWKIVESNAPDSPERQEAEGKIRVASQKLMSQLRGRPGSAAGQQRPNQQQPQQPGGGQQQQGQPQQQTQTVNGLTAEQQRILQQQQQQQQMQHPTQARAAVQLKPAGQPGQQPNLQQQQQQMQQMQQQQMQLKIKGELDSTNVVHPPGMPDHTYQTLKDAWRRAGASLLQSRESIMNRARPLIAQVQVLQKSGQTVPDNMQAQYAQAKGAVEQATTKWTQWKQVVESGNLANVQTHINNQTANQQRPGTQQGQQASNGPPQQPQLQQQSQNDAKPPVNAASSPSPPQMQGNFQQPPQGNQNQQHAPPSHPTNNMAQQQPTQGQLQQQQQTPQALAQSQSQGGQNFPPNMQQPSNPIARPQINTNAQHMQTPTQAGQQQQGTPASAVPNSASQPAPQRPQALTHNQAVSQAADAARQQNQAQGQQMQQQMPNGLPFNTQPSSTTQQNTSTGSYPNLQPQQGTSSNTKFPIPKTLALDPRSQQAVAGPPSRPTMATPGMMYQPGIQRPPPYTLEGEGDRVLSKRKLDELVRQVTGAAPPSINESESSSVLAPEVEESMLQVADNFVDDVITSACRLAKLRPNQTLDIRDIQMVLERNYGIRIPGYSLDETRIVRKFQPAPGWHSKMQAVQAGKVMNNRDQ